MFGTGLPLFQSQVFSGKKKTNIVQKYLLVVWDFKKVPWICDMIEKRRKGKQY